MIVFNVPTEFKRLFLFLYKHYYYTIFNFRKLENFFFSQNSIMLTLLKMTTLPLTISEDYIKIFKKKKNSCKKRSILFFIVSYPLLFGYRFSERSEAN